ncbi:MAG TPA: class I SAM-dependent methyltransferase [Elusimicrobiota bacterium]|nr:class I SAM-dependent methyltransferase [Elusimicrobiota bacterium]
MSPADPVEQELVSEIPNPLLKWIRSHLIELTLRKIPKTDRVLDLCCGYGFYFMINPHAQGIEGDPRAVRTLCSQGFKVKQGNVLDLLPYEDNSFDYVIAHDVLEHFTEGELRKLLPEVHRILAPQGRFIAFVPNRKGYELGLRRGVGHKLFVTINEINSLIPKLFTIRRHYPEPLPRPVGRFFAHNKEVFDLAKISGAR